MDDQVFRAGDKVYCPSHSNRIFTLQEYDSKPNNLWIIEGSLVEDFNNEGKVSNSQMLPMLFHATKETKELLEDLYGIEFEGETL